MLVLAAPMPAGAASPTPSQAEIPFANMGGIWDWAADGTRGIYIQALNRQWYYARLLAPCINLPFAERVGFVAEPGSGAFDKFSSIVVRGQECPVVSLTRSGPPPAQAKRWRGRQDTHEAARGAGNAR